MLLIIIHTSQHFLYIMYYMYYKSTKYSRTIVIQNQLIQNSANPNKVPKFPLISGQVDFQVIFFWGGGGKNDQKQLLSKHLWNMNARHVLALAILATENWLGKPKVVLCKSPCQEVGYNTEHCLLICCKSSRGHTLPLTSFIINCLLCTFPPYSSSV